MKFINVNNDENDVVTSRRDPTIPEQGEKTDPNYLSRHFREGQGQNGKIKMKILIVFQCKLD